jgi:ubiquinone/menaquinone biosynthesis C-methylase UbiE
MSKSSDSRQEHPNTYFVQDRSNKDEMSRLYVQNQMITDGMGGVLPEQPDPTIFQSVLDVGCGTGGWLIEAAKIYPTMKMLVGVDISSKMLHYAHSQAEAEQVSDRVQFHTMDALRKLDFPDAAFDLVNIRYGVSWLRTWDWPKLLQEFLRILRPGGVIRVTESDFNVEDGNPALKRLSGLFVQAFYRSGHLFTQEREGIIGHLAPLLHRHACQNVQTLAHTLEFRAGSPEGQRFYEDVRLMYQTIKPFFQRWIQLPGDYEEIYQQMLHEVQQPGFVETSVLLTAWGNKP